MDNSNGPVGAGSEERDSPVVRILFRARALAGAERLRYLDEACGNDRGLRSHVESLLVADARHAGFLGHISGRIGTTEERPAEPMGTVGALKPGLQLGPFVLVREIGSGGQGVVWLAEEQGSVTRRVAIKIIRPGTSTAAVIARFAAERSTLAHMEHPNIARLISAGSTPEGLPYVAMELVEGVPITAFCDAERLALAGRIEILLGVCDAIEHAHRKLAIHRDIKPSNILVRRDESGQIRIKVIDFGLAKLLESSSDDASIDRPRGAIIGTPGFMAPEQADDRPDIDVRADVYSLGVVLYKLLVGALPLESHPSEKLGVGGMLDRLREADPVRPSARVASLPTTERAALAEQRSTTALRLEATLRGDLDWIALRALERDRDRRYGTVRDFAADLRRHLAHEPVQASPPDSLYRIRKFIRRHRSASVAGAVVAFAITATIVGLSIAVVVAERANERAARRATELESLNAVLNGTVSEMPRMDAGLALIDSVVDRFDQRLVANGIAETERAPLVAELRTTLERVGATSMADVVIGASFIEPLMREAERLVADQPGNAGALFMTLGRALSERGETSKALDAHRRALALLESAYGPTSRRSIEALASITYVQRTLGNYAEVERVVLDWRRRSAEALGVRDRLYVRATVNFGWNLLNQGRLEEAEVAINDAVSAATIAVGENDIITLEALDTLARLRSAQHRHVDALAIQELIAERTRADHGASDEAMLFLMGDLPAALANAGRAAEAESVAREVHDRARRMHGDTHRATIYALGALAQILSVVGKDDEAIGSVRECLQRLGSSGRHIETRANLTRTLGNALVRAGRFEEAESTHRAALELARAAYGEDDIETLDYSINIGSVLREQQRHAEAHPYFREYCDRLTRELPIGHPRQAKAIAAFADQLRTEKKEAERLVFLENEIERYRAALPAEHPGLLSLRTEYATSLMTRWRTKESLSTLEEVVALYRAHHPNDLDGLQRAIGLLGKCLYAVGRAAESETHLLEARAILLRMTGPTDRLVLGIDAALERTRTMLKAQAGVDETK